MGVQYTANPGVGPSYRRIGLSRIGFMALLFKYFRKIWARLHLSSAPRSVYPGCRKGFVTSTTISYQTYHPFSMSTSVFR